MPILGILGICDDCLMEFAGKGVLPREGTLRATRMNSCLRITILQLPEVMGSNPAPAVRVLMTPIGLSGADETHWGPTPAAQPWAPSPCLVSVSWLDLGPAL